MEDAKLIKLISAILCVELPQAPYIDLSEIVLDVKLKAVAVFD